MLIAQEISDPLLGEAVSRMVLNHPGDDASSEPSLDDADGSHLMGEDGV